MRLYPFDSKSQENQDIFFLSQIFISLMTENSLCFFVLTFLDSGTLPK